MTDEKKLRLKKFISITGVICFLALLTGITVFVMTNFKDIQTADGFKEYIESFGAKGVIVGLLIQILQVLCAVIPGEAVEIGLGFAFGAVKGTIICFAGLIAASAAVFSAVKFFGMKILELFMDKEKIESLKFIKKAEENPGKLKKLTFILFLIPGTPKDLFTYFFGLTPLKLGEFLIITSIARIPSVISSTVGGMLIESGNFISAAILFVATALVSIAGILCYDNFKR